MNKQKYLHEKVKSSSRRYFGNTGKNKHKPKTIEDYENLPFRESMNSNRLKFWDRWEEKTQISFWNIVTNYLNTKIGEYWNDIYSDLISKTKPKYRYKLYQNIYTYLDF